MALPPILSQTRRNEASIEYGADMVGATALIVERTRRDPNLKHHLACKPLYQSHKAEGVVGILIASEPSELRVTWWHFTLPRSKSHSGLGGSIAKLFEARGGQLAVISNA
jgi:hypothetical protein